MASYKIDVNRLDKNELTYELTIRGVALGTVEQMRTNLAMARRMEKSGDSFSYPKYPYTAAEDEAAVKAKLDELGAKIASFGDSPSTGLYAKLQSKLYHTLNRIDHLPPDHLERPAFIAKVLSLLDELHHKGEAISTMTSAPPQLQILSGSTSSPKQNKSNLSVSIAPNPAVKPILPAKWDCKFSGDKKGMSLNAFLERIDELRLARHVAKETLLESGVDLFSGRAYQFYLAYRGQVSSWDEFVVLLKEEYLSANYNENLFEELKKRTQGTDESIGVYIAVMLGYFNRLSCEVSEETKLKILTRNLAPFYQSRLSMVEINTIEELRKFGKKLEAVKESIDSYVPPSRKFSTLEPDMAYVGIETQVDSCQATTSSQGDQPKTVVCFRCNKPGHYAAGCPSRSAKFCYRCKREGFTVRTCPQCGVKDRKGNGDRHA